MSYCVNCGVELSDGAASCPLCGTPAWKPDREALPYFPTKPAVVPPASRRAAALLLTAMLASVSLCCGLLNLILPTEHPWSLYIAGAAVMLWIWFALPMLGWACIVVFLLSFFLRDGRRSRISTLAMCIGAVGLLALGVEYCLDRYFLGAWQPSWSLAVLVICIGLIIPLRIVRRVPSLREEARRRFNM